MYVGCKGHQKSRTSSDSNSSIFVLSIQYCIQCASFTHGLNTNDIFNEVREKIKKKEESLLVFKIYSIRFKDCIRTRDKQLVFKKN